VFVAGSPKEPGLMFPARISGPASVPPPARAGKTETGLS
jgi:hypothetical protein